MAGTGRTSNKLTGDNSDWYVRLKGLRIDHNYTETAASKKLGISITTISLYENGKQMPSIDDLKRYCTVYNTTMDYILRGIDAQDTEYIQICEYTRLSEDSLKIIKAMNQKNITTLDELLQSQSLEKFLGYLHTLQVAGAATQFLTTYKNAYIETAKDFVCNDSKTVKSFYDDIAINIGTSCVSAFDRLDKECIMFPNDIDTTFEDKTMSDMKLIMAQNMDNLLTDLFNAGKDDLTLWRDYQNCFIKSLVDSFSLYYNQEKDVSIKKVQLEKFRNYLEKAQLKALRIKEIPECEALKITQFMSEIDWDDNELND